MPSMPVYSWEMTARDAKKQAQFYSQLFGWEFEFDGSGMCATVNTGGIPGSVAQFEGSTGDFYLYVQVPNVQSIVDKVPELGGELVHATVGPGEANPMVFFKDPEGVVWGVTQEMK